MSLTAEIDELALTIQGRRAWIETCRNKRNWPAHDIERQQQRIALLEALHKRLTNKQEKGDA